jgi:acetolactate synthase-1/2/3 large subunit
VFEDRFIACDLDNTDFVAVASAFGIDAARVRTPDELGGALRSAVAARAPALIEVVLEQVSDGVWPLVGRAGGLYPLAV